MTSIPAGMAGLELLTAAGEYVATAVVPQFQQLPRVLVWGSRAFVWQEGTAYVETSVYAVVSHVAAHRSSPAAAGPVISPEELACLQRERDAAEAHRQEHAEPNRPTGHGWLSTGECGYCGILEDNPLAAEGCRGRPADDDD